MPSVVPVPSHQLEATVPALNAWILWWNAYCLRSGLAEYWNAPIFFPASGALAFSEPQPITMLIAPLVWLFGPVVAYVLWLWLQLLLNGLFAFWLLRSVSLKHLPAMVGSVGVVGLPLVWLNLDAVQLVGVWPVLWMLRQLLRLSWRPTWSDTLGLSAAVIALFCTSAHQTLFAFLSIGPAALWLATTEGRRRWALHLVVSLVLAGVCIAPLAWPMLRIHQQQHFVRQIETQRALSATLAQWSSPRTSDALHPGWLYLTLASASALVFLRGREPADGESLVSAGQRRFVGFLVTIAVVSGVLSLGWNLRIGQWQLWPTVAAWIPPLEKARSLFRFAYFTQLALVLLAAVGLEHGSRWCWKLSARGGPLGIRGHIGLGLVWMAVIGGIGWESAPVWPRLASVPVLDPVPAWAEYLRQYKPSAPVVCLPFGEGLSSAALESQARWMLLATGHRHPLVNGYSGFFPADWYENLAQLSIQPLRFEALQRLERLGIGLLVVDRRFYKLASASAADGLAEAGDLAIGPYTLRLLYRDPDAVDIWEVDVD